MWKKWRKQNVISTSQPMTVFSGVQWHSTYPELCDSDSHRLANISCHFSTRFIFKIQITSSICCFNVVFTVHTRVSPVSLQFQCKYLMMSDEENGWKSASHPEMFMQNTLISHAISIISCFTFPLPSTCIHRKKSSKSNRKTGNKKLSIIEHYLTNKCSHHVTFQRSTFISSFPLCSLTAIVFVVRRIVIYSSVLCVALDISRFDGVK